jgi:hypothetical protein
VWIYDLRTNKHFTLKEIHSSAATSTISSRATIPRIAAAKGCRSKQRTCIESSITIRLRCENNDSLLPRFGGRALDIS